MVCVYVVLQTMQTMPYLQHTQALQSAPNSLLDLAQFTTPGLLFHPPPRYLHSRNFVHGDLRSPNLFVASDGRIKIGDFGFCRILAPEAQRVSFFVLVALCVCLLSAWCAAVANCCKQGRIYIGDFAFCRILAPEAQRVSLAR